MATEQDTVARADALGGGSRKDFFEPSVLSASSEGADVWGGPLEPSALGGAPILVLCILGLVSVAWTAFGAASFGRERGTNAAKATKGPRGGDRTPRPAGEDVRVAPPSTVGGAWATSLPPAAAAAVDGEEAVQPSARSENGSTRDGIDDTVCFSDVSSYTMRSSELAPPSDAAERSQADHREPGAGGVGAGAGAGGGGGGGGVGVFFNGNEWRRGGRGGEEADRFGAVDAGVLRGAGGCADGGRRKEARRRHYFCDGGGGDALAGEKEPGADSCETGEEGGVQDRCCDSSRASSSFADLKSLEVAHWEGPAPPQPRWHTEAEAASEEHGGVADRRAAAAGSATEANTVEMQSVPGREARHDTTPVAAAAAAALSETKMELVQAVARDKAGTHGGDPEEVTAAGGQEGEGGEQERRLLGTIKALLAELERDLDAARVLLPECHRFRKVVGCVSQAVGPGMSAGPRQAMDVTEALREATEYSRTLSSPEAFLVVMAELLADGFEDPTAMLGYCTRRLSCAVSALPEPSSPCTSSRSLAAAARMQLRSLAMGPNPTGGGAAGVNGTTRSSSGSSAAAAAALAATVLPDPSTTASSSSAATMAVTPIPVPAAAPQGGSSGASSLPLSLSRGVASADTGVRGGGRLRGASATSGEQRRREGVEVSGQESGGQQAGVAPPPGNEAIAGSAGGTANGPGAPAAVAGGGDTSVGDDAENGDAGGDGCTADGSSPARGREGEERDAGADPCDPNLRGRMGPAFTNEAAGLNELIRRRGGLSALSDARTVAAVLRAAAPRRQSAFHLQPQQPRQARGFFEAEPEDGGAGGGGVPLLYTPPGRGPGGGREASMSSRPGSGEEGSEGAEAAGNSTYVSTTCGGFFGTTKSPMIHSPSGRAALPWPSPQDANGVCQKLARRVEARIEAMVPFAFPNPTPASERRRVRNANGLLFCIMGGRPTNVLFDRKTAGGNEGNGPHPAAPVAARRGGSVSGGRQWSSGGGAGGAQSLMPNLEAQLYAGLGSLLEAAKELLPGARDGGAAVNAVGQTAVLTLKGASALDRAPSVADTSLSTIPRRTSMCQHTVCAPRLGRKTLDGGTRYEDGVLLVPDCRKLRQEIVRSTCMDPGGSIRPDYIAYAGAPIFIDGAPLGTFCVFSRRTLKDLGWSANHTVILRGLADAAATEMVRLCRIAGLEDQQRLRHRREQPSSPHLGPQPPAPRRTTRQPSRNGGGGNGSSPSHGGSSRSSSATRRSATALLSSETAATAAVRTAARPLSFSEGSRVGSMAPAAESPPPAAGPGTEGVPSATPRGRRANGVSPDDTPPDRDGVLFLNGLDDRGGGVRRSMSEEGPGAGAGFRPPPVLARRCTGESVGRQAAAVAAAAAMAAAASSESPRGGTRKRWQRALRKLRLRPRRKSMGGGSDEGDNGSSSSLDVSRRRTAGGHADSQQVFRERSRAW